MFKKVNSFISDRYQLESSDEKRKFIGLSVISTLGLMFAVYLLVRDLIGAYSEESIPGDVALFMFFSLAFYNLHFGKLKWAVNTIFLIPFVAFFYFISYQYSVYPVPDSINLTLLCLLPGFLVLILFDEKVTKVSLYFIVTLATVVYHLYVAEILNAAITFHWPAKESVPNPISIVLIAYLVALLISWNYSKIIRDLRGTVKNTGEQLNKSFKSLQQGMMILEIENDEFETPVNLIIKRVNPVFESQFRVPARELRGKDAEMMFPRLFRGAFDWNANYMVGKKQKFEFYAEHLDRWFEVYTLRPGGNQLVSFFTMLVPDRKVLNN